MHPTSQARPLALPPQPNSPYCAPSCDSASPQGVGQERENSVGGGLQRATAAQLKAMSLPMLNRYINSCARLMFEANKRYEAHGFFADAGERDAWLHAECDALVERGSRPEVVRVMEEQRGLR